METEKLGIENVEKLALLLMEGVNVGTHWGSKGLAGYVELARLTDEVMMLPSLEYSKLDDELKDMDAEEVMMLKGKMLAKLDLPGAKGLAVADKALGAAARLGQAAREIVSLIEEVEKLKAEK